MIFGLLKQNVAIDIAGTTNLTFIPTFSHFPSGFWNFGD